MKRSLIVLALTLTVLVTGCKSEEAELKSPSTEETVMPGVIGTGQKLKEGIDDINQTDLDRIQEQESLLNN